MIAWIMVLSMQPPHCSCFTAEAHSTGFSVAPQFRCSASLVWSMNTGQALFDHQPAIGFQLAR